MRLSLTIAALCTAASTAIADPTFWVHEWPNTDFENTTVTNWVQILSGGPPKDGIPALDNPDFLNAADEDRLTPREPVYHRRNRRRGAPRISHPLSHMA